MRRTGLFFGFEDTLVNAGDIDIQKRGEVRHCLSRK